MRPATRATSGAVCAWCVYVHDMVACAMSSLAASLMASRWGTPPRPASEPCSPEVASASAQRTHVTASCHCVAISLPLHMQAPAHPPTRPAALAVASSADDCPPFSIGVVWWLPCGAPSLRHWLRLEEGGVRGAQAVSGGSSCGLDLDGSGTVTGAQGSHALSSRPGWCIAQQVHLKWTVSVEPRVDSQGSQGRCCWAYTAVLHRRPAHQSCH